jgi:acyl dehydratase
MRFAELTAGRSIELGPRSITETEVIEFARRYDPQFFHVDPERAAASRWGGLIASGWMTAAVAMQMVVPGILDGSESIGSPGLDKLEWTHPVRPGDTLRLRITVLEQRVSSSGKIGIVRWTWNMRNQAEVTVMNVVATSLFDLKNGDIPNF